MENHIVYWYRLATHTDPYTEGYVGVTNQPQIRHRSHVKGLKGCGKILHNAFKKYGAEAIQRMVLHTVPKEEAYTLENHYRPQPNIGWNIAAGGGLPPDTTGRKDSQEVCQKRAESVRRTKAGKHYPSVFKGVKDRYTKEQRALIGSYHKGKTISDAHKKAITEKNSGANNPHAQRISLVHVDKLDEVLTFSCIRDAAEALNIGYNTLRSQAQRVLRNHSVSEPNRLGWICMHPTNSDNCKSVVHQMLAARKERFTNTPKARGASHHKAKQVCLQHIFGEIKVFDTILEAASYIGTDESTLRYHIAESKKKKHDTDYARTTGWKVIYQQAPE